MFSLWKNTFKVSKQQAFKKKIKIFQSIDKFISNQYNSKEIKPPLYIDETLAKIIGAFCADGSLSTPDMIRWEEEHLSSIRALANWFKECFDKDIKIEKSKRGRNSWTIKFRSKIIKRYLTEFFNFKPGIKKYSVRAPEIIRKSSFNIQKAFALGAMMFDGGVYSDGRVGFGVVSKKFRDDMFNIIKKEGVDNFTKSKLIKKENGFRYKPIYTFILNPIKERNGEKLLSYFEKNTIKWKKLKEHIYGFTSKVKNLNEAKHILRIYYYKELNEPKMDKLLDLLKVMKKFDVYDIIQITETPRGTMCGQLNMFCKFNILNKKYENRRIVYTYNKNLLEWRLPDTTLYPSQDFL